MRALSSARWLALASVVLACNTDGAKGKAAASTATATATATASAAATSVAIADANDGGDAGAKRVVWSVVRWEMTHEDVVRALEREGMKVEYRPLGAVLGELRAKGADHRAEISFVGDRPKRIVVTRESLSKEAALAIVAKTTERAAAPPRTSAAVERRWDRPDNSAVIFKVNDEGFLNEDYARGDGAGRVGFATLTWRMTPAAAKQAMTAAGFDARIVEHGDGEGVPGEQPTVSFTKGERSGEITFGEGISNVALWGPSTDRGASRAKDLERTLGAPTSHKSTTTTRIADDVAVVDLVVVEDVLTNRFELVESYGRKP